MALKRRKVDFKQDFEFTFIGDGNNAAVNVLKRTVTGLVGYPKEFASISSLSAIAKRMEAGQQYIFYLPI